MAKKAILRSDHQEVARLSAESLDWIYCMAGQPNAEDLLKVTDFTGKEYWCDEIEFIKNIPEQKEVVINNVDKLVSEYHDSLLPHVNALCHKSILNIATWSYRQGIEEMIEKQGGHTDKIVERAKTEKQRVLITESDGEANIDWDTRGLQDVKLLLEYGLDYVNKLERQGEQKSAGWSEEDEVNLTNIFLLIKEDASLHFIKDDITKGVAWLESLKGRVQPQNHWKPSKEQMQALLSEVEGWVKGCPKQKVLESLYNDLKKLTEE